MDPQDTMELQARDPHLAHLVVGFRHSSVCKLLKDDIDSSLNSSPALSAAAIPYSNTAPAPSSASIVPNEGNPVDHGNLASGSAFAGISKASPGSFESTDRLLPPNFDHRPSFSSADQAAEDSDNVAYLSTMPVHYARPSIFRQFAILSNRAFTNFYRDPMLMLAHYGISILFAGTSSMISEMSRLRTWIDRIYGCGLLAY
jgi:hypothetical protein